MASDEIVILGRYRLLEYIAEGAFGEVFYGLTFSSS